jgi:hypothetical protein
MEGRREGETERSSRRFSGTDFLSLSPLSLRFLTGIGFNAKAQRKAMAAKG